MMRQKICWIILVSSLLLFSCTKTVQVKTDYVKRSLTVYEKPDLPIAPEIKFKVIDGYFALSEKYYLDFAQWLNEVSIYIKKQNVILNQYEKDIENESETD